MAVEPSILSRLLTWNKKSTPETVDSEQYAEAFEKFKALLLEQYQLRLQTKTAKRLPINLSAKSTDFGMDPDRARAFLPTQTIESQDIAKEIDKILHTHDRLLIIGDPGAGKTTILLFAAINILMDKSREQKLPLIINLATWQTGRDFKEWYAQSIAHTYSLSLVFAEELLRRNVVVPFFDGFDEVAEDAREDCLQKMSAYFGDLRSRQLIVSSRKKEYAATKADAPVYVEIEVQPLSLYQIKKALSENAQTQAADRALLDAIERDAHLAKAVETPFYLNTASFLFGKGQRTWGDFPFRAESAEGRQGELVEIFVGEQVPDLKDRKHLGFLAWKMEEENFLVFELVDMQPSWVKNLWRYRLVLGLVSGLSYGLTFAFFLGLVFGETVYSILGLIMGFLIGFLVGWGIFLINSRISTDDIQILNWAKFSKNLRLIILIVLSFGLFFSGIVGLIGGWKMGLVGGLLFGLVIGLDSFGTTTSFFLYIRSPYKRFWADFRSKIRIYIGMILAFSAGALVEGNRIENIFAEIGIQKLSFGYQILILGSFFLLLTFANSRYLDHISLRLSLYLEKKLPLRLVTFLDRMSDQYIFEDNRRTINGKKQRGATWRFRHKILQDYFAKIQTDPAHGSKR